MKVLFDTSVLVPCFFKKHPNHEASYSWYRRAMTKDIDFVVCSHTLAELYNTLSTLPLKPRLALANIIKAIDNGIAAKAEIVSLSKTDYLNTLREAAKMDLIGGSIYDALIVTAAKKAKVDRVLTYNIRHFHRAWPDAIHKISTP